MYIVYTDGSTGRNPGPGGYSYRALLNGKVFDEFSQGYFSTTNNRMELMGAISALEALPENSEIKIVSDSKYVVDGAGTYLDLWIEDNELEGRPNADLWELLVEMRKRHKRVIYQWVKGHSGNEHNEWCDKAAKKVRSNEDGMLEDIPRIQKVYLGEAKKKHNMKRFMDILKK